MRELDNILSLSPLPSLVVFDLDYTIWPFYCDCEIFPPVIVNNCNQVVDGGNNEVKLYSDVVKIFVALKESGIQMAAASRSNDPVMAAQLLNLLKLDHFFCVKEIYPGSKLKHFEQIKKKTNIEYIHMVFFDDEPRNIADLKKVGVTTHLVRHGLKIADINEGFKSFRNKIADVKSPT